MSEKTQSTGIGLGGLVFIVFLVLKLAEIGPVAKWSWWWVTSPLWIPVLLVLGILLIIILVNFFGIKKKSSPYQTPLRSRWERKLDELKRSIEN